MATAIRAMHTTQWLLPPPSPPFLRWQQIWACMLPPLTIWICVSATLRYGYYGDSRLLLGPASSRLIKASSVFVKELYVSNRYNNQVILHACFNEKPELSSQTNWTESNFFLVAAYSRKGISLWLNKGSTIRMRWEAHTSSLNQLQGVVIKGQRRFEKLQPKQTSFPDAIAVPQTVQGKEAEYIVEEDDKYHIGVLNMNARNIILTMNINVSAKVYDTTKANMVCSTANGSCRLSFLFPNTHYVILTAPNNRDVEGWYVEASFEARVLTYVLLLGFMVIVVYLILKFLGVSDGDDQNTNVTDTTTYRTSNIVATQTETEPLTHVEPNRLSYGTNEEDDEESGASSSCSEELYDEKLCVICYDEQRNSFFVPCGHCATCYDCAQRIVDGDSKVCPICRRLIHKVRRLFHK